MCFNISQEHPEAKIAEKSIVCWKCLQKTWFSWLGIYFAPVKNHVYGFWSKLLCKKVKIVKNIWSVEEGYHSFIMKDRAHTAFAQQYVVKKFIIPAGTTYYENETEYVAERILMR